MHVAAYIENLRYAKSTVKLHLTVIRTLFNWFLVTGITQLNPAAPVRGPKNIVRVGKTPAIEPDAVEELFDSIPRTRSRGPEIALCSPSCSLVSRALELSPPWT